MVSDGPPLPGEDGFDEPVGPRAEELRARAQVVATKARRANVNRKDAVKAATFGEKESARELSAEEAADTLRIIDERAGQVRAGGGEPGEDHADPDLETQATDAARMALSDRVSTLPTDLRHDFLTWLTDRGLPTRSTQMTKDEVDAAWEGLDSLEADYDSRERLLDGLDGD
jgi:hypothetical protein